MKPMMKTDYGLHAYSYTAATAFDFSKGNENLRSLSNEPVNEYLQQRITIKCNESCTRQQLEFHAVSD